MEWTRFVQGAILGILIGMVVMILLEVSLNPMIGWG